jgi:hypothetical protein
MQSSEKENADNKREFMRIDTALPMKISLVPPEEISHLKNRAAKDATFSSQQSLYTSDNQSLDERLNRLDSKLDLILQLVLENQNIVDMSLQVCNISAGGMSIISHDKFSPGDTLEVKMVYPSSMPQILHLYGEVLRSEKKDDGYLTALRFIFVDDSLQDKIVKLVFEKEREIIREKRAK